MLLKHPGWDRSWIMKRVLIFIVVLLIPCEKVISQNGSPYHSNWQKELGFIIAGTGLLTSGLILNQQIEPLTEEQVSILSRDQVWAFDRSATYNYSPNAANASNWLLIAGFISPLTLPALKTVGPDYAFIGLMAVEAMLINYGITSVFKGSFRRIRPFVYNDSAPIEKKLEKTAQRSFFSGHVSNFATLTFFTAKVIADHSNNKHLVLTVWATAISTSALMGYLRFQAGKHFPTDVIAGYTVGALVGIMIPQMHKKVKKDRLVYYPYYFSDSFGLSLSLKLN